MIHMNNQRKIHLYEQKEIQDTITDAIYTETLSIHQQGLKKYKEMKNKNMIDLLRKPKQQCTNIDIVKTSKEALVKSIQSTKKAFLQSSYDKIADKILEQSMKKDYQESQEYTFIKKAQEILKKREARMKQDEKYFIPIAQQPKQVQQVKEEIKSHQIGEQKQNVRAELIEKIKQQSSIVQKQENKKGQDKNQQQQLSNNAQNLFNTRKQKGPNIFQQAPNASLPFSQVKQQGIQSKDNINTLFKSNPYSLFGNPLLVTPISIPKTQQPAKSLFSGHNIFAKSSGQINVDKKITLKLQNDNNNQIVNKNATNNPFIGSLGINQTSSVLGLPNKKQANNIMNNPTMNLYNLTSSSLFQSPLPESFFSQKQSLKDSISENDKVKSSLDNSLFSPSSTK